MLGPGRLGPACIDDGPAIGADPPPAAIGIAIDPPAFDAECMGIPADAFDPECCGGTACRIPWYAG